MKKLLFNLVLLGGLVSFLASCKSGEAYTIKMRLKDGDNFEQQLKMNMNMNMSMMGKSMDMKMGITNACRFDVMAATEKEKQLKMTYTDMQMSMSVPGMGDQSEMMDSILNKSKSHIIGKSVTLVMDDKNNITDVLGFEQLMADSTNPDMAQTREMVKGMFSKDQVKSMWGMMFAVYPGKPVHVGDTWKGESELSVSGMKMKIKYNYKLKAVHDGLADIELDGVIDGKGSMTNLPVSMEMDMKGKQNGTMTVKLEDGYIRGGKYSMDVSADMDVMGQKIPVTMKGDYEITGK
jgi:hypothetical protein